MKIIPIIKNFLLQKPHIEATISNLRNIYLEKDKDIALDFSELEKIKEGDIMVLSAQIEKTIINNNTRFYRNGKLPQDKAIRQLFSNLPQVIHVKKNIQLDELSNAEKEKLLIPKFIDKLVKDLKKIGIKEYFYDFNSFLTELIANAVEHGIENKNINFWLNTEYDKKEKKARYTFVDMGIGIIDSHKKAGLPLKYKFSGDYKIVIDSLYGVLGSSTGESNRGKGLPQLKDMIVKEYISDLVLITNNVTLHFINGEFVDSRNSNFVGTYYSWTINQENFQKWKNII
jgi:hypothetical protein